MVGVTTVALLERRPDISRDLFSRYWRDVHGVMAARIPGFDSYVQHHVTPLDEEDAPFEGIAVVGFRSEDDRIGLSTSAMTAHIHRDEQNVFRRALLYSLPTGALVNEIAGEHDGFGLFVVVPEDANRDGIWRALAADNPAAVRSFDLTGGDPADWNDTHVDDQTRGRRFVMLIQATWEGQDARDRTAQELKDAAAHIYVVDEVHAMVLSGRATPVGLRGLDAVRTIREAGAENQLDSAVEDALYGSGADAARR